MKADINNPQGKFGSDPGNKWHPWKYNDRVRVAAAVEKKKTQLNKTAFMINKQIILCHIFSHI